MIQSGRGTRLAAKAFQCLRVSATFIGQEFQGDEAAKLGVLGFVDNTHPAAAELLNDAVVRDGLADQSKTSLLGTNLRVDTLPSQRRMHLELK